MEQDKDNASSSANATEKVEAQTEDQQTPASAEAAPAAGGGQATASAKPTKPALSEEERARKQQEREDRLRQWREEEEERLNPKSAGAKLFGAVDGFLQSIRGKVAATSEKKEEDDARSKEERAAAAARRKRILIFSSIGLVVIAFAVVIAMFAPLQMKRSAGFAAFQKGDYPTALGSLQEYLIERPQDYDALYLAAQAALFSGDVLFAEQSVNSVYRSNRLQDSNVGYYYALFNFQDTQQALQAVEQSLRHNPQHLAARLLRGILLGQDAAKAREAREDFLQASEIVRRNSGDALSDDINALYLYFQSKGYLSLSLALPPFSGGIHSNVSRQLGFSPYLDGFQLRMRYSAADDLGTGAMSPGNIISYFFIDMLLRHGELQEAGSVLEGLQREAADVLTVTEMAGFYAAASGDYAEAKTQFEKVLEQLSHDPTTINNLATVELLAVSGDAAVSLSRAIGLYRRLLELDEVDVVYLNNGAYVAMLGDDMATARNLLDRAAAESAAHGDGILPAQGRLTRALLLMLEGESEASAEVLATISERDLPGVNRYLLAVYEDSGNVDAALTILEQLSAILSAGGVARNTGYFLEYVRLLSAQGEWALALIYLQEYLRGVSGGAAQTAEYYGVRYMLGLTALQFADAVLLEEQRQALGEIISQQDPAQHYAYALEAAIAERAGDASLAAQSYLKAIDTAEEPRLRYAYLMAWAQIQVEINPREVAAALRGYLKEYDMPGIKSILAYALAEAEPEEAIRYAQADMARNKHSYLVNLYAGAALTRTGRYLDGLDLLIAANNQRPAQSKVLEYLGKAYLGAGDVRQAERTAKTLEYLAAKASGEWEQVSVSFKIHLPEEKEDIVSAVQNMVRGRGNYGDVQEAYALALGAERNTKKRAEILYSKATFESYNKTYEKAAGLFGRAVGMGLPNHEMQVQALLFYYEVLQLTERYDEAKRVVERLISVDGERLTYRRMQAQVLANEDRESDALQSYLAVLADYPDDLQSYYAAADLHMALEENLPALALLKMALFVAPADTARVYELLARVHRLLGKTERSVQYSNAFSFLDGMQRGG